MTRVYPVLLIFWMLNLLNKEIEKILTLDCAAKTLFLGMGNTFRSDDGIGPFIIAGLKKSCESVVIFNMENKPELYLEDVIEVNPDKTVIFDAADFNGVPGEIKYIEEKYINNITLSTHTFPPGVIAELIKHDTGSELFFIGIQAVCFEPGDKLSPEVKNAGVEIINFINKEIEKCMN